jgi:hypothetical protein
MSQLTVSKVMTDISLLVPGDPGRLGTPVYVIIVETSRPVEARFATRAGKAHSFT